MRLLFSGAEGYGVRKLWGYREAYFCYEYHLFYALTLYSISFIPFPILCNLIAGSGGTAEVGSPLRWVWVVGGLVHRLRDGLAGPRGWAGSSGGWTLGR
jgi:hypothetical protein